MFTLSANKKEKGDKEQLRKFGSVQTQKSISV
jgi:hypothetical protein